MMQDMVKVRYENYNVVHTDGWTYTRVHTRDRKVWIPRGCLPKEAKDDEIYEIPYRIYEYTVLTHYCDGGAYYSRGWWLKEYELR